MAHIILQAFSIVDNVDVVLDHYVVWLDVAMNDAFRMQSPKGLCHLDANLSSARE